MLKFLKGILLNNLVIKIVALVLAIITWSYISALLYIESLSEQKEARSIIEVSGEKLIVKTLPIYVDIEGQPAPGYEVVLEKIAVIPLRAVTVGKQDVMNNISYITTVPIKIQGAANTVKCTVSLQPIKDAKIVSDDLVKVTIPIARQRHK